MFGMKKKEKQDTELEALVLKLGTNLKQDVIEQVVIEADRKMTAILQADESIITLKKQKSTLEGEIAKLKSRAKIEETEIKTLIKVEQEKNALALDRKELELQKVALEDKARRDEKYHTELAQAIDKERGKMEKFMEKVMAEFQGRDIQVVK